MFKFTVYEIKNLVNGKLYIGQTSQPILKRWKQHIKWSNNSGRTFFCNAIRKYGADNFSIKPIITVVNKKWVDRVEKILIKAYKTTESEFGYNSTIGGEGTVGYKLTKEQLVRHSENSRKRKGEKRKPLTEEWKQKVSTGLKKYYIDNPDKRLEVGNKSRGRVLNFELVKKCLKPHIGGIVELDNYELTNEEKGQIAAIRPSEGFKVLNRLLKAEVFKLIHRLIVTDYVEEQEVLKRHMASRVAAEIYDGFIHKINEAITDYTGLHQDTKPIDVTEGVLDLGEYVRGDEWK